MRLPVPQEISSDLLTINGENIFEIKSYHVTHEKVWKDTRTNMAGGVRNTLVGTRVIIEVNLGAMDRARAKEIYDELKQDILGVAYFDPMLNATRTASFYIDGWDLELFSKTSGLFPETTITLNPVSMYRA